MNPNILQTIKSPADIKSFSYEKLELLAAEIRQKEISTVSQNGGHLASNLGVVELTIALHKVFNSPNDKIIFDVGHQCYAHKLLTGRYSSFDTLRKKDGISGFPNPQESKHDIFYTGHSGTAISSGLGLAQSNQINNKNDFVISVIGDGSFTGGMVYEAMNNGGRTKAKHIIVLNDNNMSISESEGSFAKYLAEVRSSPKYYKFKDNTEQKINSIPAIGKKLSQVIHNVKTDIKSAIYPQATFFEDLGYRYIGPIDGHNIRLVCMALESAKHVGGPVLLHVITKKGKGYNFAEKSPSEFHGVSKFDIFTGEEQPKADSFSSEFGKYIVMHARQNPKICTITAAMSLGTGLEDFKRDFPERFFDVGIAEEHAVTFAAGLAKGNLIPVFAVYSAFFQRCYDQLVHDVSLQNIKVIFAVDRAGFVGDDGQTHNGLMDVPFLNTIPNIKVYSPCTYKLLKQDLDASVNNENSSVAIRYPRGKEDANLNFLQFDNLKYAFNCQNKSKSIILTYGRLASEALKAFQKTNCDLCVLNQIKPISNDLIDKLINYNDIFFYEEGEKSGGVGQSFALKLLENGFDGRFHLHAVPDEYAAPATYAQLLDEYKLSHIYMIEEINKYGG